MEVTNWTQTIQRGGYVGVISGVKEPGQSGAPSAPDADTLEISEAGRRAAMAAEMEKGGGKAGLRQAHHQHSRRLQAPDPGGSGGPQDLS